MCELVSPYQIFLNTRTCESSEFRTFERPLICDSRSLISSKNRPPEASPRRFFNLKKVFRHVPPQDFHRSLSHVIKPRNSSQSREQSLITFACTSSISRISKTEFHLNIFLKLDMSREANNISTRSCSVVILPIPAQHAKDQSCSRSNRTLRCVCCHQRLPTGSSDVRTRP